MRLFILHQEAFKQQPRDKPARGVVQADHFGKIPSGTLIVPRAEIAFAKPGAGDKLTGKNYPGIDKTAEYEIAAAHYAAYRGEQGCKSVDGKHPDGSGAWETQISSAKSMESGKRHFQKPTQQPTVYKIVNPFFHMIRMPGCGKLYTW